MDHHEELYLLYNSMNWLHGHHSGGEPEGGNNTGGQHVLHNQCQALVSVLASKREGNYTSLYFPQWCMVHKYN